jgi:hypothetical protein
MKFINALVVKLVDTKDLKAVFSRFAEEDEEHNKKKIIRQLISISDLEKYDIKQTS